MIALPNPAWGAVIGSDIDQHHPFRFFASRFASGETPGPATNAKDPAAASATAVARIIALDRRVMTSRLGRLS